MRFGLILVILLTTLSYVPASAQNLSLTPPLCFKDVPGIQDCIDDQFRAFWEQNGGLATFGYPRSPALPEETADGLQIVQHFERYRLELHPENPSPYTIQLGRLGADLLAQSNRDRSAAQPTDGCRFFQTTRQNVCGIFEQYWRANGLELGDPGVSERESLALLGLPLTEARLEINTSGDRVPTQWFERARLEDHNGTIRLGLLNVEAEAATTPAAPAPGFVTINRDKLVQNGQPIVLKGINYYPAAQPWGFMWLNWNGPAVAQELSRARRELGVNTVRILVPYRRYEGWTDGAGNVQPHMLDRLREFVQLAGEREIKVLITLFDWEDPIATPGSDTEQAHLRYLRTIVSAFKDDDRVLAWDLHNEPDNYTPWNNGKAAEVVAWLGRMADEIRAIDRRHPLTVGVGKLPSLWQAAPDGRTIADISDIISVHSYDAMAYPTMAPTIRQRTTKPVLLEEFGWSTGPECRGPYFDETSQLFLYRKALAPEVRDQFAGMLSWWYQDPPATLSYASDENGYFGLFRRDGKPKPAVAPFRTMRVPALPSTSTSAIALTVSPPPRVDPIDQPLVFDNGMVLSSSFKHFWNYFGGEAVFGKPITLAYRDQNDKLVQYFERARFELNEAEHVKPIDPRWPEGQTPEVYLDRVRLTPLGAQLSAERSFARVPNPQQPGVLYFEQTGHTLRGDFRATWEQWGEIFFGPPISEPLDEVIDGQPTRVQYFTHWRFEQQGNGPVRFAPLGTQALQTRQCPRP